MPPSQDKGAEYVQARIDAGLYEAAREQIKDVSPELLVGLLENSRQLTAACESLRSHVVCLWIFNVLLFGTFIAFVAMR